MKFQQVSVGQRFEFEGRVYIKLSPLLAQAESSGGKRLLPRSATVRLLEREVKPIAAPAQKKMIDADEVAAAIDQCRLECVAGVEALADVVTQDRLMLVLRTVNTAYAKLGKKLQD